MAGFRSAVLICALLSQATALDNGVGLTPAMGYNTWDDFRCGGINASNLYKVADAIVKQGLDKLGYKLISLDDCWATGRDKKTGVIIPDPKAFPDGMKAVADYVHNKGLLYGVYTDRGTATCVGRPGSEGFEKIDAQTYASWGVDYLKEDSCNAPGNHSVAFEQYGLMRDALNATGRRIYFDLCGWSSWYAPVGKTLGNAWRVGYDVNTWSGVLGNALAVDRDLAQYAGPGGWNDIDALIGTAKGTAVSLTQAQSRSQFNLWCLLSAQLIIGGNILHMTPWDLETYTNKELIAINQDPKGVQAVLAMESCQATTNKEPSCQQVWLKGPMSTGDYAIAFMNTTNASQLPAAVGVGAAQNKLAVAPCNSTEPAQKWNVTANANGEATLSISDGTVSGPLPHPTCMEVNGCNFSPGQSVDTNFGCKVLPPPGGNNTCAANMAWLAPKPGVKGPIKAAFDASLCLEVSGGASIATCDGSRQQMWTLTGPAGAQQIESGAGFGCVSNGEPTGGPPAQMAFDVTGLGWKTAKVTDLWSKKVSTESKLVVSLPDGGGASSVFLLSKAS